MGGGGGINAIIQTCVCFHYNLWTECYVVLNNAIEGIRQFKAYLESMRFQELSHRQQKTCTPQS